MHGRVVPGEVNNRLRAAPSLNALIVSQLPGGSEFDVIADPTCGDGFTWVPIRIFGQIGYTAEGDANSYWIEPYSPEATAESSP
ncbi:MAG: SH3 domain-containing protein [Anaerolineae bacterium]